ncbi:2-hydroxyacylsphingosine 1-beta-galactosyltransferase-like [Babylonia areolata]|uniref:2-hydroxyacylsphingosine 1-beta-galactosyltransferase-like n=1 Tax=Babylonia areolata TaxID=304850 RepID=UPI003FD44F1E
MTVHTYAFPFLSPRCRGVTFQHKLSELDIPILCFREVVMERMAESSASVSATRMRAVCVLVALCACSVWKGSEGKRVLMLPMPFTSHTKYHTNVARALSALGHEVWVTMPDYLLARKVLDTSSLTVVEYQTDDHIEERIMEGFRDNYFRGQRDDWFIFINFLKAHADNVLTNQSFFQEIKALRPEFVIIDNIPNLRVMSIIPYRLGIPFAFLGTAYDPIAQRVPFSLADSPVPIFPFTHHMTLAQKLQSAAVHIMTALYDMTTHPHAVSRYAPEMPYIPLDMLVAKADLWLVEVDHVLDYPRPSLPNVKLIGGTATGPAKPLSPPFSSFMDTATQGVVIVSFGSYILDLPKPISDKVFKVLMELPFKAVFRSNLTSPDPGKILTAAWIPQNDLLGHSNTKVFVSHSGKNGQYEALFHAVPVLATPIFADQVYNAERARTKGFGETVDIRTVSAEEFREAIVQVATTKSYKDSISKASEIFQIEFGVPMERAAFWLDHVMKYGGAYMHSAGQEMPFYQFLGLDVLFCYFAVFLVILLVPSVSLYLCYTCMFCRRKQKIE